MQSLSRYRIELMGLGIIWIMLFHSNVHVPEFMLPVRLIKSIGYAGVEIFFLLSGVGLSFSLKNNKNVFAFYKRRLKRIVPVFWFIVILTQVGNYIVTGDLSLKSVLLALLGLGFIFYGKLVTWFIPAIFICYIFFPAYYYLSNKYGLFNCFVVCSAFSLIFSVLISSSPLQHLLIFTIRIPVFLLGAFIGQLLVSGKSFQLLEGLWFSIIVFVVSLIFLALVLTKTTSKQRWANGLWWYPTILMAYPLCILLGHAIRIIDRNFSKLLNLIRPFGIYSLELYLIHAELFLYGEMFPLKDLNFNILRVPEHLIYVVIALLASVVINKVIGSVRWLKPHNKKRISSESRNESSELILGSRSRGVIGEKVE